MLEKDKGKDYRTNILSYLEVFCYNKGVNYNDFFYNHRYVK